VYVWADGVYLQARMEPRAECMLVLIGATPEGRKELVRFQVHATSCAAPDWPVPKRDQQRAAADNRSWLCYVTRHERIAEATDDR
jgi:hypothetical protein